MKPVTLLLLAGLFPLPTLADPPTSKPKWTIGKETTYVTGPLDKDGYVDYAAALNERLGKGVTPDSNAAVLLWKAIGPTPDGRRMAAGFYKLLGVPEPPDAGDYFVDLGRFAREHLKIESFDERTALQDQQFAAGRRPWKVADYPHIASWLTANEKPLAVITEACRRPHYFLPKVPKVTDKGSGGLISVPFAGTIAWRPIATALVIRAMRHLADGKTDQAWDDLLTTHRLGRHLAHGSSQVDALVGIAIDQMASRADLAILDRLDTTGERLAASLRDLRALPPMPGITFQTEFGERAVILDSVMLLDRNGLKTLYGILGAGDVDPKDLPDGRLENINWDPGLRLINRWFDRLATATRAPDRGKREELLSKAESDFKALQTTHSKNDLEKAVRGVVFSPADRGEVLAEALLDMMHAVAVVHRMQESVDRNEQGFRNLQVAFALAAHRADHKAYPKALADLAPKYLDKIPDDLFTGKPLVYRPTENGFLLYSLGPNGKDDDGRGPGDDPKGDDIAVRVPVPLPPKK
jgi:hypothetical protein